MRLLRFAFGLAFVLFALWIILFEQLSGASANAFINARLTTIYAPIAGRVELPVTVLGSVVSPNQRVATIKDDTPDSVRRDDLSLELALELAERGRIAVLRDEIETRLSMLATRTETFRTARLTEVENALGEARVRLELLRDGQAVSQTDLETGDTIDADGSRTQAEPLTFPLALSYARDRVARLKVARNAIREGIFLGDGFNDAPFSEQRAVALRHERETLNAALDAVESRITAYEIRLQLERQRVNRLSSSTLLSPVRGLIWELRAASGERIQRGMPLATIADCSSIFISLSVSESVFNTLKLGQAASFRPTDTQQVFDATISRLSGPGSQTFYRNLAVAPSQRHLERYDVTLLVPTLAEDPEYGCAIGRTGRAFFDTRPLDIVRDLFR